MAKQACSPGFEKILVATDGSLYSNAAVQEAIKLASTCSSTLYVLLVIEVSAEIDMWDASAADKLEKEMRNYLNGIKAKAAKSGVKCEVLLHLGDEPYKDIVTEAAKRKVSAIVMGSHESGRWAKNFLLGGIFLILAGLGAAILQKVQAIIGGF